MIETRINLHNECCGNCGSDFTEGEMVLMSFLEENCYCENCTNGILSEASSNGYLEEFNQYLLNNGVGKLAINSFNILDCIDDGIYELLKINGKAVIESRHQENVKSEEYFKAIGEESFLLERRGKSLIVIIQQNSFMDIYDYKEFKNQHKDIIHDIQMSSDASEVEFICNENDDI